LVDAVKGLLSSEKNAINKFEMMVAVIHQLLSEVDVFRSKFRELGLVDCLYSILHRHGDQIELDKAVLVDLRIEYFGVKMVRAAAPVSEETIEKALVSPERNDPLLAGVAAEF
jgi:hypothetical protein